MSHRPFSLAAAVLLGGSIALTSALVAPAVGHATPAPATTTTTTTTVVALAPQPTGSLTSSISGSTLDLTIDATGFGPGSIHSVAVADNANGFTSTVVRDVIANSSGAIRTTVATPAPAAGVPAVGALQIDLGDVADSQGTLRGDQAIAVAPVVSGSTTAFVPETGQPTPPIGVATLTYDPAAQTLSVTLDASGFAPGSTHAADLDHGTCAVQSGLVRTIPDFSADSQGLVLNQTRVVTGVTSFSPAAGTQYLDVHLGDRASQGGLVNPQLADQPALCGAIGG